MALSWGRKHDRSQRISLWPDRLCLVHPAAVVEVMMDDLLRIASLIAWSAAFVIFLPGAVRGFRSVADDMDWFWMAAAFACANRVTFGITNLFAPELLILSQ